ncbi:uncharacterized protein LOC123266496 [Cotesia glomerata]|uniref:Uncharacterized protein n=1 Tax=Cotesia glomerata TaxID=32391 RepID=A0AAV7HYU7_COTGL|nr:uncharacterized protein LOC123266496 [Cotesia glomerata]XP_044586684.1 uncharacterized protein LOC123266496 [Cotesia glomerata]XP_044586685.1 uncharacterized protein LOC123266496 [Cotesia glomerata]XP_044586686.1 uncharacterized protein LOC123266496 [Cotesia glomerata]KAH0535857.1 hypothetical protein KQX54_019736 [Cotesia glomerata]
MANKRIDRETGELADENYEERLTCNYHNVSNETGEPEINDVGEFDRRLPFKIPREIREELLSKQEKNLSDRRLKDLLPLCEDTAFGEINPVFLFLPAVIYFKWFAISLMIFEFIFHGWSHHKNKTLKDVYYRSPFHGITSEYCALCQFETCMIRVGKMQQIRMHKFLHGCNYMKRAVT